MAEVNEEVELSSAPEAGKFGQTSYHYWHDHGNAKKASGDVASMPKHIPIAVEEVKITKPVKSITKFAFDDGKKKVKVYVDFPGIGEHPEDVSCTFGKKSFDLRVTGKEADSRLCVPKLYRDIVEEESSYQVKEKQIVVSLKKLEESSWHELKASSM